MNNSSRGHQGFILISYDTLMWCIICLVSGFLYTPYPQISAHTFRSNIGDFTVVDVFKVFDLKVVSLAIGGCVEFCKIAILFHFQYKPRED